MSDMVYTGGHSPTIVSYPTSLIRQSVPIQSVRSGEDELVPPSRTYATIYPENLAGQGLRVVVVKEEMMLRYDR
jgi:hypothetical protein